MDRYEVIIYWSDEDQAYVAEVPELPGCSAHGDTYEAALSNARQAIALWIETAKEFNDPIPAPKGRRLAYA
ncbi:MAG TPA: type II toxin-antitoxin system HicB family antitoxin [Thermodesulfobacteriota bacterium]|nr:type II toxin-antitoxin system HicB family antitoxin [Deltaproteobacteria bacterium]HNR14436.1 type II toxin-antitoxin system HicB family antitoxin [Thermodesulfobacteriota bacterium]HNU72462.1 type II toxin-antitoxin system HicB family antitoxin [Thermodesulfobacteriota bacterium]HQO79138.1 type II toxin-antitoxin system HicB family antitoxin [Thermodesulfobacteriota bacterium]